MKNSKNNLKKKKKLNYYSRQILKRIDLKEKNLTKMINKNNQRFNKRVI